VRDIVPADIAVGGRDPKAIAESFKALARDLEKESVAAAERVRSLTSDLERRRGLEKEIEQQKATQSVYNSLALELRGDRIVDYLQSEALVALAAAGSDRLEYLSGGRYRLSFENDEFFVVDAWNGEDRRSVKTLSGGETFLASLALALALSDEVKNLAVADKAPIDSLFLDEGFGQLDAESLEVVISAIEQLGGDGRMVGVITHVPELAERLPVRIVVEKSPRGSRLRPDSREEIPLR
jgi:exonuclease SbcC